MALWCCICGDKTKLNSHFLCSTHYTDYGLIRPMPDWLRELKKAQDREEYHQLKVAPRALSLDLMTGGWGAVTEVAHEVRFYPIEPVPLGTRSRAKLRKAEEANLRALLADLEAA